MTSRASPTVDSFLGGEWSPLAQGRISDPLYKRAMNVCRNGLPIEEGSWVRRSGFRFPATTLNGNPGRVIHFDFEQNAPYILEFTDSALRAFGVSTQTGGLTTPLPADFRLVTTNDNQQVSSISTANPAVVQTSAAHGWATGDQIQFLIGVVLSAGFVPLLRNRVFKITVVDTTHFSLADPITSANIDGSTLGWSSQTAGTVVVARVMKITTPFTIGIIPSLRKVQAEQQAIFLSGTLAPYNLQVASLPSAGQFATFSFAKATFLDGPYLDPPKDGTILTPNLTAATSGTLPSNQGWNLITANGSKFLAASSGSTAAATSTDGVTWSAQTLPFAPVAMTANGTIFVIVGSGTQAATSTDGATWVTRTLSSSGSWNSIAWNGSVFCVVGFQYVGGPTATALSLTSPDGITWTSHTIAVSNFEPIAIAWNGTAFAMTIATIFTNVGGMMTSPDGITWTTRMLPGGPIPLLGYIAAKSTVFAAISYGGNTSYASTDNGVTWIQGTLPVSATWDSIAGNTATFVAVASGIATNATSTDGINWTSHALPSAQAWDGVAWNGTTFCIIASGYTLDYVSTTGVFSTLTLTASSKSPINSGSGFQPTDVGRQIRLFSEPLPWFAATTYAANNTVKFNGAYYVALQGTNTGHQPDVSPTFWGISPAAAAWTWGIILTVNSPVQVVVTISGGDLLYPTIYMTTWRLGLYSDTTSYPTCGLYYQGRLCLAGAVANRIDMSKSNDIFNMAPTGVDGTVASNNGISYIFNSTDVNQIFWLASTNDGIVAGTQAGEWLVVAPTAGPISPTNIFASRGTTYGSSNIEPAETQLTLCFVQRFNRTLLEYFPDVFSRRFTAPNLTETAKHLTVAGIQEIRYQQELVPTIWNRMGDGSLKGVTYERDNLFSSQPAKFVGWHRHDLGGSNLVESMAVGPNEDGSLDALTVVMNNGSGVRHIGIQRRMFDIGDTLLNAWFLDDSITPSGGVISGSIPNSTLTLYGLWHLNGQTVSVFVGGIDVGDFAVSNGSVAVPIDNDPVGLFTRAYLASIASSSAYGAMGCPIDGLGTVPAVVGFTYTSQGQLVRPDVQEQNRSPTGSGLAKPRRLHQFGANMVNTQGIRFGTDFTKMHAAILPSSGGSKQLALNQLFTGVLWATADDTWGFGSQLCWDITRPYPASIAAVSSFLEMQDR